MKLAAPIKIEERVNDKDVISDIDIMKANYLSTRCKQ